MLWPECPARLEQKYQEPRPIGGIPLDDEAGLEELLGEREFRREERAREEKCSGAPGSEGCPVKLILEH